MLQQPYDLYKGGWADTYVLGLVNQVAQAYDDSVTQEVTNHLFQASAQGLFFAGRPGVFLGILIMS